MDEKDGSQIRKLDQLLDDIRKGLESGPAEPWDPAEIKRAGRAQGRAAVCLLNADHASAAGAREVSQLRTPDIAHDKMYYPGAPEVNGNSCLRPRYRCICFAFAVDTIKRSTLAIAAGRHRPTRVRFGRTRRTSIRCIELRFGVEDQCVRSGLSWSSTTRIQSRIVLEIRLRRLLIPFQPVNFVAHIADHHFQLRRFGL
jgi:hypothetical protein